MHTSAEPASYAANFYPAVKAALRHESADSEEDRECLGCDLEQGLSPSFNRFVQMADSFRNESSDYCLYEWVTESLTHLIRSNTWIHSVTKHRCVALRHKTVLLWL